jgi:hypothetical protein
VIIVEWPADSSGWALTLGPPHPFREFGARTEAGEYLGAPLGLRIFTSLPGARVPATTTAIRAVNAPHAPAEFIPHEAYGKVTQVYPRIEDDGPALVSYDRNLGCITVHPRKGGLLTVGRMSLSIPKHAWRIAAQIHLAHERASLTEFGLMACAPNDGAPELTQLNQLDASSPSFSGWKSLSALETKSISALIPELSAERLSIYLLTRQAPDSSPDFGWARFDNFEFNILPKSMTGENDSDELEPVSHAEAAPAPYVAARQAANEVEAGALGIGPNAEPA